VSVGSRSDNDKKFHSFGTQAAKLRGPKVEVRQAGTCKSPRAAERKWRRLVLAVSGTHSSWRYSGAVWRHLKMIKQSLKTILSASYNLQRVPNTAVRILSAACRTGVSSSQLLSRPQWLPVHERNQFEIATIT